MFLIEQITHSTVNDVEANNAQNTVDGANNNANVRNLKVI